MASLGAGEVTLMAETKTGWELLESDEIFACKVGAQLTLAIPASSRPASRSRILSGACSSRHCSYCNHVKNSPGPRKTRRQLQSCRGTEAAIKAQDKQQVSQRQLEGNSSIAKLFAKHATKRLQAHHRRKRVWPIKYLFRMQLPSALQISPMGLAD